jgi:hypothetical protein
LLLLALWFASDSAAHGPGTANKDHTAHCQELFMSLDTAIGQAGVADSQTSKIAGFPYLRVNRFLASFAEGALTETAFQAWVDRMQMLESVARRHELANLLGAARERLDAKVQRLFQHDEEQTPANLDMLLHDCTQELRTQQLATAAGRDALRSAVGVCDDYSLAKRLLGFYPLSAIPFSAGIRNYQKETRKTFATDLTELPIHGQLLRYAPGTSSSMDGSDPGEILGRSAGNALAIPEPLDDNLNRLFARFAPVFEIDVADDFDRIGRMTWSESGAPRVDTIYPTLYRLTSHTRFGGQTLLQLNYIVWFPRRPKGSRFDLLGGELDSIIWRVTLHRDGTPLAYDTVHGCGCYHLFFPTEQLTLRRPAPDLSEKTFVAQVVPPLGTGQRLAIRVASRTHYVERIYAVTESSGAPSLPYQFSEYDELRSLARADGVRHSLFGPDGLIAGSERGERFLFWPMGIASAGAMRQWGHHATAFVGKRHFDDANLFEHAFVPAEK